MTNIEFRSTQDYLGTFLLCINWVLLTYRKLCSLKEQKTVRFQCRQHESFARQVLRGQSRRVLTRLVVFWSLSPNISEFPCEGAEPGEDPGRECLSLPGRLPPPPHPPLQPLHAKTWPDTPLLPHSRLLLPFLLPVQWRPGQTWQEEESQNGLLWRSACWSGEKVCQI